MKPPPATVSRDVGTAAGKRLKAFKLPFQAMDKAKANGKSK